MIGPVTKTEGEEKWKLMIGSVTKNGGRREMETYDRICDQKRREKRNGKAEERWKLMIGSVTKTEGEEKWKLMIGSVTRNGGRREMEAYDRISDQKRREKRNEKL